MFSPEDILYEDNHVLVANKRAGDLVQPDPSGNSALENEIKAFLKRRDAKPGAVFLGIVHRIDRPVSGAVLFAKTSKALARLNEMIREREIEKTYWAIVEKLPPEPEALLVHHLVRDDRNNRVRVYEKPTGESKEARLQYRTLASGDRYHLLEVKLLTGRHHQIRAQLAKIGSPIRGDLKYGAARSNPNGGISLHARQLGFVHPVSRELVTVTAPAPEGEALWRYFVSVVVPDS